MYGVGLSRAHLCLRLRCTRLLVNRCPAGHLHPEGRGGSQRQDAAHTRGGESRGLEAALSRGRGGGESQCGGLGRVMDVIDRC